MYLLLEGINSGHVQAKFYEDGKTVSAACESDRAMLYSFKHDGKRVSSDCVACLNVSEA